MPAVAGQPFDPPILLAKGGGARSAITRSLRRLGRASAVLIMAIPAPNKNVDSIRDISSVQWKAGIAAWLGWLFDGMDGTLYTLAAPIFVAQLLQTATHTPDKAEVGLFGSWIQFWFLIGWACGGAFFGRIGDRFGRTRTIMITILTYALFTGLSAFAHTWQELAIYRFLAALGIGGEWAAGSSLVAETWPKKWRPELSAVLQSAYQVGFLVAAGSMWVFSTFYPAEQTRWIFLIGALPALITFWIRRNIPEPDEWSEAKHKTAGAAPGVWDLFRGDVLRTTVLTILVCSVALTAIWALIFWGPQHLQNLPDIQSWAKADKQRYAAQVTAIATLTAIAGNFCAAFLARRWGYRVAACVMFVGGVICMSAAYAVPHTYKEMFLWLPVAHFFIQGIFGLFPLYVPPLFPTLLRTSGAGFCYNIGRVVAAIGTVVFGLFTKVGDYRMTLFYVGLLPIAGALVALAIPEPPKEPDSPAAEGTG